MDELYNIDPSMATLEDIQNQAAQMSLNKNGGGDFGYMPLNK